jgi:hypothetical protein
MPGREVEGAGLELGPSSVRGEARRVLVCGCARFMDCSG